MFSEHRLKKQEVEKGTGMWVLCFSVLSYFWSSRDKLRTHTFLSEFRMGLLNNS